MFSRIMVPLDGSRLAETVLPLATTLARATDADLLLVRVAQIYPYLDPSDREDPHSRAVVLAEEYLASLARRSQLQGLRVSTTVAHGPAAEGIIQEARAQDVDLIVMATRGRSGLARWTLGSVTDQVLHTFSGGLLVVRPADEESPGPPLRILVPLDGSELATRALNPGAEIAERLGAELVVVHVLALPERPIVENGRIIAHVDEQLAGDRMVAEEYLSAVVAPLRKRGLQVSWEVRVGDATHEIEAAATASPDTLVVMSTHGRSGLARWLHGSVADQVVRTAQVPVLLQRAPESIRMFVERPAAARSPWPPTP